MSHQNANQNMISAKKAEIARMQSALQKCQVELESLELANQRYTREEDRMQEAHLNLDYDSDDDYHYGGYSSWKCQTCGTSMKAYCHCEENDMYELMRQFYASYDNYDSDDSDEEIPLVFKEQRDARLDKSKRLNAEQFVLYRRRHETRKTRADYASFKSQHRRQRRAGVKREARETLQQVETA